MREAMSKAPAPSDDPVTRLVTRLHATRKEHEGHPAARRRAALARELDLQLAQVPAAERNAVLERALGMLRPSARPSAGDDGNPAAAKLRAEIDLIRAEKEALSKERDLLHATRDALLRENAKLRSELDTKATAPAPVVVAGGSIEAFRSGLKDAIAGKKVDPDKLGLPASEVRVFRLTQELVNFIHMLERGRIAFLNEVESGPSGGMGTQILKGAQDQVRKQILAVLNDEEGSIRRLRKTMDAQNRFILGVPDAFQGAIPKAVAALLAKIDPEPILARSKKILTDYERAWADFVRTHSDLSNLTPDEIWDTYFKKAFKEKLDGWTKADG
jgi:hypothetical protein